LGSTITKPPVRKVGSIALPLMRMANARAERGKLLAAYSLLSCGIRPLWEISSASKRGTVRANCRARTRAGSFRSRALSRSSNRLESDTSVTAAKRNRLVISGGDTPRSHWLIVCLATPINSPTLVWLSSRLSRAARTRALGFAVCQFKIDTQEINQDYQDLKGSALYRPGYRCLKFAMSISAMAPRAIVWSRLLSMPSGGGASKTSKRGGSAICRRAGPVAAAAGAGDRGCCGGRQDICKPPRGRTRAPNRRAVRRPVREESRERAGRRA
jgi:hypothetical protein